MTDEQKAEFNGAGSATLSGWRPQNEKNTHAKELSTSDRRSIKSLEEQIKAYEDKLAAYKPNPDAFDNHGHLKNISI